MMSQILLFSIFYAGIEENNILFFLGNLKFIHILFFSIFKALSNKSNVYFAYSSPLRDIAGDHIH